MREVDHINAELLVEGPVETQTAAYLLNVFLGRARGVREERGGIAGQQPRHQEHGDGDADQHRDSREETLGYKCGSGTGHDSPCPVEGEAY